MTRPPVGGYICEYTAWPGIKWGSSSDLTSTFPGITCEPLAESFPDSGGRDYYNWLKIAQLIAEL